MPVAAPHSLSPGSCPSRRSLQRVGCSLYKVLKLTFSQIVNKLYTFYETQIFITMKKKNQPLAHMARSLHILKPYFFRILFNFIIPLRKGLPSGFFIQVLRPLYKHFWFPVRATCPAYFSKLYYITVIIYGDYKSWSPISGFLVHAHVIASILVPTKTRY